MLVIHSHRGRLPWHANPHMGMLEVSRLTIDEGPGRRQLIGIAAAMWLPPLLGVLLGGIPASVGATLVPSVLLVGLTRGWHWARTWTVASLGIEAVAAGGGGFIAGTGAHRIINAPTGPSWGAPAGAPRRPRATHAHPGPAARWENPPA